MKNFKRTGKGYQIKAAANNQAEILIYEDIGEGWAGGITAKQFAADLKELGKVDQINVRINSPGGSVFDGVAIYNTLIRQTATIVVDIDGLAASIASVIAMAGATIRMSGNALMMIHEPWTMTGGNADQLREQAALLDKVGETLLNTYANRATAEKTEIAEMMKAETWLTAEEALAHGLVDEITEPLEMAASALAVIEPGRFKNAPAAPAKSSSSQHADLVAQQQQTRRKLAECNRFCKAIL